MKQVKISRISNTAAAANDVLTITTEDSNPIPNTLDAPYPSLLNAPAITDNIAASIAIDDNAANNDDAAANNDDMIPDASNKLPPSPVKIATCIPFPVPLSLLSVFWPSLGHSASSNPHADNAHADTS